MPTRSHPRLAPTANFTGKLSLAFCARRSELAGRRGRGLRVGDSDLPACQRHRQQPEGPSESTIFTKWSTSGQVPAYHDGGFFFSVGGS